MVAQGPDFPSGLHGCQVSMEHTEDDLAAAFERALGLTSLDGETGMGRAERAWLEQRLAPLAEPLVPVAPSSDLFARITAKAGIETPLAGIHVVRHDEGQWKSTHDGITTKTLWRSPQSRRSAYMLRMQPGSVVPEHDHFGDEELMVLEGDLQLNGVEFGPGDFQVAFAGSKHASITTRGGCLCLISVAL